MKNKDRVILGALLLIGLGFSSAATAACSTSAWLGGVDLTADSKVGSPDDVALPTSRYSEFCSLAITNASYVQSNYASDNHFFGRVYVFPKEASGTGTVDLLVAYTDEAADPGDTLFKTSYDGSDVVFSVDGSTASVTLASGWNLIEFEYDDENDIFNYWVNEPWTGDAVLAYEGGVTGSIALTADATTGSVEAIQLGAPNGFTGTLAATLYFDAYEAHRTTNVGALMNCDAEGDMDIDINDILAVVDEVFAAPSILAMGQPDCDSSGQVNINDVLDIVDILF